MSKCFYEICIFFNMGLTPSPALFWTMLKKTAGLVKRYIPNHFVIYMTICHRINTKCDSESSTRQKIFRMCFCDRYHLYMTQGDGKSQTNYGSKTRWNFFTRFFAEKKSLSLNPVTPIHIQGYNQTFVDQIIEEGLFYYVIPLSALCWHIVCFLCKIHKSWGDCLKYCLRKNKWMMERAERQRFFWQVLINDHYWQISAIFAQASHFKNPSFLQTV